MSATHIPWPESWNLALTDAALKESSSSAIFSRALAYAKDGSVLVIEEDPMPEPSLRAEVMGSQPYTTEVWIEDDELQGECDCPHAEEGWFCKHQVAVALVWRKRLAGVVSGESLVKRDIANIGKKSCKADHSNLKANRATMHDFLRGLDAETLAAKLLSLAKQHPEVQFELNRWHEQMALLRSAKSASGPAELEAMVSQLMSTERAWKGWGEAGDFLGRAEAVLPLLEQTRLRDPEAAVGLGMHAMRQAWEAMEEVDDSDGALGEFWQLIADEWLLALEAAGPQVASFGEAYLQLHLEDPYGDIDANRAEVAMGSVALDHFRAVLAERWRAAKDAHRALRSAQADQAALLTRKAHATATQVVSGSGHELDHLERMHLGQLEQTGQVEAALEVLMEDLTEPSAHSRVIVFLERHQRFSEALAHAHSAFADLPDDRRLEADLLRCVEREGLHEQALGMRQALFDRDASVERYLAVLQAGERAGRPVDALRQRLLMQIEAQEIEDFKRRRRLPSSTSWRGGVAAHRGPDVSLRAAILCAESRWLEALALVQASVKVSGQAPAHCDLRHLESIAVNLPKKYASESVSLLRRVFDDVMPRSSSPYEAALSLVKQIGKRMDTTHRSEWLLSLRVQYKAKRNFIRDLPTRW
jgi:uncharacterized Zn finger protein